MSQPPEALRLAGQLDAELARTVAVDMLHHEATAELRRLHAENEALRADLTENEALRERMRDILRRVAVTLRGPEPELTRWSWHDLPERAAAAVAAIDVMRRTAQMVAEAAQEPADVLAEYRGEGASQWVKVRAWLRPGERIVRVGGGDE